MGQQDAAHFRILVLAFVHDRLLGDRVDHAHENVLFVSHAVLIQEPQAIVDAVVGLDAVRVLHVDLLFDEAHEGRALDLHWLPVAVVERYDKVKKVAFAQVVRWLFFEMGS